MASISRLLRFVASVALSASCLTACNKAKSDPRDGGTPGAEEKLPRQISEEDSLPPEMTSGFDGKRAFAQAAKLVGFGPRPSGSRALMEAQQYITTQLSSYGCTVATDVFDAQTPVGRITMKNIVVKIPGDKPGIILLGTHYDTKRIENFVGADDGGSSTAVMLELARLLCGKAAHYSVWIAFFDGEEAIQQWSDTDSRYGSRQMAAKMAISGDLPKIKAFLLADMVGSRSLRFKRDSNSTAALVDLVWNTAARLNYDTIFVREYTAVEDDHISFLKRRVPSVDVINMDIMNSYWHTVDDTLDKISAKSLAITGHVFIESVKELQSR
jgi:Zn-dependent M28 family amino/carboxypeptidase